MINDAGLDADISGGGLTLDSDCAPWSDFPCITHSNISNIILKFHIQVTYGMPTLEGYGTVVQLKCSMAKNGLITCTTPCTLWFI